LLDRYHATEKVEVYVENLSAIAIGYLFSLGQVYFTHQGRDGQPGLSIADIKIAYHGSPDETRLATAIKGPMAGNLKSADEQKLILNWINSGAKKEIYQEQIAPVLQRNCLGCHSPASGMKVPPLTSYDEVIKLTESDQGASIPSLIRVSHIHVFGIAFILFFVGRLFVLCDIPVWLKRLTIGIPFLSMMLDILAWYLTRQTPSFAYLLVISGAMMGLSLNFQIGLSLIQMWLPAPVYWQLAASAKTASAAFFSRQRQRFDNMKWQAYLLGYIDDKIKAWLTQENKAKMKQMLLEIMLNGIRLSKAALKSLHS
jgi:hypothetical protein